MLSPHRQAGDGLKLHDGSIITDWPNDSGVIGGSKTWRLEKMSFMSPFEVRHAYAMQKAAWVAKLPKRVQTIMPNQSESLRSEFNSLGKRHISKRHISANIKDNIDANPNANPNANMGRQCGPGRRSCRVPLVF